MPASVHQNTARNSGIIREARAKVPTIQLADVLTGLGKMKRRGAEWVALCPLPDHDEKTPSFTVNPSKNLWFCHGCVRGGDVIELARFAWGYERREAAMAAADLLHEFGHDLPPKPESFYARQQRQKPVREALEEAAVRRVQRRLYRWILAPIIATFEDDDERREEAVIAWEDCGRIARLMVVQARGVTEAKPGRAA